MLKRGAPDTASLYIFDEADRLDGGFTERVVPYLSEERREKVFSYRFSADRTASAVVYLLLRLCLKDRYGIDEPVAFSYGNNEKPLLRDYPVIHFSLSHCGGAVACAVSGVPVGVDVEDIAAMGKMDDGAARMVLTPGEYAEFKALGRPEEFFCEIWATKESFLKKTGQGIGADLRSLPADGFGARTLLRIRDYYCCVTGESRLRRIGAEEFCAAVGKLKKNRESAVLCQ